MLTAPRVLGTGCVIVRRSPSLTALIPLSPLCGRLSVGKGLFEQAHLAVDASWLPTLSAVAPSSPASGLDKSRIIVSTNVRHAIWQVRRRS